MTRVKAYGLVIAWGLGIAAGIAATVAFFVYVSWLGIVWSLGIATVIGAIVWIATAVYTNANGAIHSRHYRTSYDHALCPCDPCLRSERERLSKAAAAETPNR